MMTIAQAAAELGISPKTARRQALIGHLAAVKYGRDWLVTTEAVEQYRRERLGVCGLKYQRIEGKA